MTNITNPELSLKQLEEEGDFAADYLEELLDIADIDGDLDITVKNGRVYLAATAPGTSNLSLLAKPDTVAALQELTRLAVQVKSGNFSRMILDISGSRDVRAAELFELVQRAAERIREGASEAALPPMSSYERKLIHDLAAEHGLTSVSQGEGASRYTVLMPAKL